jgi:phospholipid-binding lipoprotein MlaA
MIRQSLRRIAPPRRIGACLLAAMALASTAPPARAQQDAARIDWDEGDAYVWDPFEPVNRGIFQFNETLDEWALEPVATAWDALLPNRVQQCLSHFFTNLVVPLRIANDLLQWKPIKAFEDTGRLLTNTTLGIGGLFDPATHYGIPIHDEDFGQTLGRWGVPAGPYLVLPILGPSNPRDAVGLAVDSAGAVQTYFLSAPILISAAAVRIVNERSLRLEQVRAERAAAFDFYAAVRNAYSRYRENRVRDRIDAPEPAAKDDDLYHLERQEGNSDE